MSDDELRKDIEGEFRRTGFVQHGSGETPSGALESVRLLAQAEIIASLEAGVRGEGDPATVYPNWVYEARDAIRHQNGNIPWLPDLLKILGWQGGTVHQALQAVARLVAADLERRKNPHGECDACGFPYKADGTCSRRECCNSD